MLLRKNVRVVNAMGLHTRPATTIVKMLQGVKSHVRFKTRKETINAKSIMGILLLAASKNSVVTIEVEGDDAETVMDRLVGAFAKGFEEG